MFDLGLLTHLCSFMFAGGVPTEILIEVSIYIYTYVCMYNVCMYNVCIRVHILHVLLRN